jgi:hypothetical protein
VLYVTPFIVSLLTQFVFVYSSKYKTHMEEEKEEKEEKEEGEVVAEAASFLVVPSLLCSLLVCAPDAPPLCILYTGAMVSMPR